MFTRALVVVTLVLLAQLGCSGDQTGPASGVDPSLVGSWVNRGNAIDESGVSLCTYVTMRVVLNDTGRYDWDTVDSPPWEVDCEAPTYIRDSGVWRTHDGTIAFAPPPMNLEGATLELSYALEGNELQVGAIVFERE
jgi:hypothetical protein